MNKPDQWSAIWKLAGIACAILPATSFSGAVPALAAKDTLVIAIPGLPQGVDLDKHISPQTWTMAAQLDDWGLYWESGPYPYGTNAFYDPTNVPGFEYPVGYTTQKTAGGIMTGCDLSADGKDITYHLRPGVISAYGNEFTADDVIWRFDRERKRPIIYALISRLFNVDKAKYEKVDKYTVKLTNPDGAPLACQGLTNFYYPWLELDGNQEAHDRRRRVWRQLDRHPCRRLRRLQGHRMDPRQARGHGGQ